MPRITPAYRDTLFASRLRQLMQEKKISCRTLGDSIRVSSASIANYRTGKCEPDIDLITDMCKFFDVSADWLLGVSNVRRGL